MLRANVPGLKPTEEVVAATRDGAADGAEAGSRFGPVGAGVGAGVGAAVGFLEGACPLGTSHDTGGESREIEVTETE